MFGRLKLLIGLALIGCGVLALASPAKSDDINSIASASVLASDSTVNGKIDSGDWYFYRIDLNSGDTLTLDFKTSDVGNSLCVYVFTPDVTDYTVHGNGTATVVGDEECTNAENGTAELSTSIPNAGRYTIALIACDAGCWGQEGDWTYQLAAHVQPAIQPAQPLPPAPLKQTITVKGVVSCSTHDITGVWVATANGVGHGFASWKPDGSTRVVSFSRTFSIALPTYVALHVGCGGTKNDWWSDNWTPPRQIAGSATLYASCNEGSVRPTKGQNSRCSWRATSPQPAASVAGGYPWATKAVCVYGTNGGAKCADPLHPSDQYNWGIKVNGAWQLKNPQTGAYYRNCTDYVAWRLKLKAGHPFTGDAKLWKSQANGTNGWTTSTKPYPGDIAWWGNYDHVAVVVAVTASAVTVAEYNWPVNGKYGLYGTRVLKKGSSLYPQAFLQRK